MSTSARFRAFAAFAAVLLAPLSGQSQRPLTHDDCDQWKSLRGTTCSRDGAWIAYQIEPQWGDGVLEIREVAGERVHRQPMGSGARFAADGRSVVFTIGASKVEARQKKIDELRKKAGERGKEAGEGGESAGGESPRPESGGRAGSTGSTGGTAGARRGGAAAADADAPARERGELAVLDLQTGAVVKLGKVKSFTVPEEKAVLVYHLDKPEAKPAAEKQGEAAASAAAARPAAEPGQPGEPEPAAAAGRGAGRRGGQAGREKPDPLEKKRPEGTELIVRDLATGTERRIGDVVAYGLSRKAALLWYHTSAKKPKPDANHGLFAGPLVGGEPTQLLDGAVNVANVVVDRSERVVAFTSDREEFAAEKPSSDLYLWEGGAGPARRVAYAGAPGMPIGKCVAGGLSFSRDGSVLAFEVHDVPAAEPLPILPEDRVVLDIWNWRDGALQTQQQKRGNAERNPAWSAVWHRDQGRLQALGDDRVRTLRFVGPDGARMLGTDGRAYEREATWDGRYADVWLVNSLDGSRTRVLEKLRGNVTNSPGGRYLVWFGPDYHWWSQDVVTGARRDLTGGLPVPFHRVDDDHPEPDGAHGLGGWTEGDAAVLLYDEFDVWKVSLPSGEAVCVTDGFGRANRLRLRVQQLPGDDEREWVGPELLLAATQVDTMAEGFFADALDRAQKPQRLLLEDKNVGDLTRPRGSQRLFFTMSTFAEFPDLWTAAADFSGPRRLSCANPQQKEFRWGKAGLVHWIDGDGEKRTGVLVVPDGFDPKKKYPMLVHFYERMSQGLHSYVPPAPGTSPNASYYVSNGYLWFMPDVHYDVGYPGESCVKCVVSGVQHLIAQGFVDEKGIGAAGHSWGGYQTAFLVTRTNIFAAVESGAPVSNMMSAYGGIRYETGMSRQFQYEQTQSRIGGTPWEYPLRYQENSPIWFADKVQTPVLILHNDQDGAVPWTQGIEYFTALRRLGKECYLFNYNGEGHGLRQRQNQKDWTRRMSEYFDHHLRGAPAPKWMTEGVPYHERELEKLPFAPSYIDAHVKPAPVKTPPAPVAARVDTSGADAAVSSTAAVRREEPAATAASGKVVKLTKGTAAPAFQVADETGSVRRLEDYRGRPLLVWFYPKAGTPGCTTQGCGLRDAFAEFEARGVAVLGVSVDAAAANKAFRDQHGLPFPLLCDVERTMAIAYGAAADASARTARRIAVLIDGEGRVVHAWSKVDPKTFAADALAALPL